MKQKELRSYHRRSTTRTSGYHTCGDKTGGECLILRAQKFIMHEEEEKFIFYRDKMNLVELFLKNIGMVAFGGYIFTTKKIVVSFVLTATAVNQDTGLTTGIKYEKEFLGPINEADWNSIGFHKEISLDNGIILNNVQVEMTISSDVGNALEFISFDLGAILKEDFRNDTLRESFHKKTSMHVPYLYYLESELPFETYLSSDIELEKGRVVVLKSCNRCGRYLPINIENEINTLSFSLHCKKTAPCVHSTFRAYTIKNMSNCNKDDLNGLIIENGKVVSYYGHQLECKACKKFFVNAPLNPQRNSQQFREDGLRRRAIEVLINHLLKRNLVHFEFENRTKKQFSEYIWKKFGGRCFKCNKKIPLDEMQLDHTMPCAYLYRLDETATCLCSTHNSQKSDNFPVNYYTIEELERLSKITGLSTEKLQSKDVNQEVLALLIKNVVWFYDDFLMTIDYQKIRDGIKTADKINDSLKRVIGGLADLAEEYRKIKGKYPNSVTIK